MAEAEQGGQLDWQLERRQDGIKWLALWRGGRGRRGHVALLQVRVMAAWWGWWLSKRREEGTF